MANITAELKAIEDAVYGEEVRGSIHDAIQKINTVVEANETLVTTANTTASTANTKATNAEAIAEISFGNAITSQVSPVTGFVTGESYFNNVTNDLWKCNGIGWDLVGNLKGAKGDQGTSAPTISSIALTSKVGLVSTYTISLSDGSNYTFQVSDGAAGAGTGDMLKSDYDKNNNGVVDAAETVVSGTKIGQSAVLVELSEDSDGDLNYKGNKIKGGGGDPATASQIGLVKPDSLTTFVDSVGTLSAKPKFNTADSTSLSTMTTFDNVALITTDEAPNTLFNKLTNVVKNVRWLLGKIGADKFADISSIGDGTVTGAISDLNSKIDNLPTGGGSFFEYALDVTMDSDLYTELQGQNLIIKQKINNTLMGEQEKKVDGLVLSTNTDPSDSKYGKWSARSLGKFGIFKPNGTDEIMTFDIEESNLSPAILIALPKWDGIIFKNGVLDENSGGIIQLASDAPNATFSISGNNLTLKRNGEVPMFTTKNYYPITRFSKVWINFTSVSNNYHVYYQEEGESSVRIANNLSTKGRISFDFSGKSKGRIIVAPTGSTSTSVALSEISFGN